MKYLNQHLVDVNETYFQHLFHALRFSSTLAFGAVACLTHALFPFLCVKTGSKLISGLHHDMVTHRDSLSTRNRSTENIEPEPGLSQGKCADIPGPNKDDFKLCFPAEDLKLS